MPTDEPTRRFCCVPKCMEPAEGAVLFALTKEQLLCDIHLRPQRAALLKTLTEATSVAPPVARHG